MNVRHRAGTVGAIALIVTLAACSANARDYAEQAERFLTSDDAVKARFDTSFTSPECNEPPSTKVGTRFTCTADDSDGDEWTFEITIRPDGEYAVAALTS